MDRFAAMQAYVRVVEAGTFTKAADLLNLPKPTVTRLIQTLESHLQTKLLNRTTRRVTVTADGAAYYDRALRILGLGKTSAPPTATGCPRSISTKRAALGRVESNANSRTSLLWTTGTLAMPSRRPSACVSVMAVKSALWSTSANRCGNVSSSCRPKT